MIKIISDPEHLLLLERQIGRQIVAEAIDAYPGAVDHILNSLARQENLVVLVRHPTLLQWLKNLASRYPQGVFVFETLDARQALAQKWGVALPEAVRNEEIQASSLLQLDLHAQPGQDFTDLLLSHDYSPLLCAKTFPFTYLPALFQAATGEKWQANRLDPLRARTLRQRLEVWKSRARSSEQRQFIEWFAANPGELLTHLMAFRVLQRYPTLAEALLGAAYPLLAALKLQLSDLAVDEARLPSAVSQVTYHLNALTPQSAAELEALLDQVSGLLWVEYEILQQHLHAHPEWISTALLDRLEARFDAFSRRLTKPLASLRAQIRPPKPQSPEANWSIEQMLAWATRVYLPYQAWCSLQEQFDQDLYAIGDQFSAWLMTRWNDIHANSGRMAFNILPKIAADLNLPGRVHLMLVIDNLGWSWVETLRGLFQARGLYLTGVEPYLAMLPSETEISKKCLLSGAVGYTAIDETSYKGILEKGWVPYFNDHAFRYLSDIGKLNQVGALDAQVYVVNYLEVDKTLHKSADQLGMPHREHVRHLLENLVENVAAFIEKHTLGDSVRIHILSDHGSTQIPADFQNDLDPTFFKTPGFDARSQRYLEVSAARFATLADNLKLDCFFLPAPDFLLPANVLCARRANRFLSTDKNVFVHGGLLPEEVIVPYMTFEPASIPLKPLDILMKKNLFRYRRETVELEIGNPNTAAVEQVQVSALNGNVEWDFEPIPLLNGHHHQVCQVAARFKLTSLTEEQTNLRLRVRFRARGETHTDEVKLPIVLRKMVEEKSAGIFDE